MKLPPYPILIVAAIALGLAPLVPEPHLVEKLRMLFQGELRKPIDIFDLFLHGGPLVLLALKVGMDLAARRKKAMDTAKGSEEDSTG